MGPLKKYSINFLLLSISFLFVCVLAEIFLRATDYGKVGHRDGNHVQHTADEFNHFARLNVLGLRGAEIEEKSESVFRILILGDSFTYGLGVDEELTFVSQAERKINENKDSNIRNKTVEIINGGISASGPIKQGAWLLENGMALAPDLVVMAFYIGNDIYDDIIWREGTGGGALGNSIAKKSLRKILFIDWLWSRLINIPLFDKFMFDLGLRYTNRGLFMNDMPNKEKEAFSLSLEKINWLNSFLQKKGLQFMVMLIPTTSQVKYGNKRPINEDFKLPNKLLTSYFIKHNIKFIDLLPLMLNEKDKIGYYYVRDPHWTKKGHTFVAKVLAEKLKVFFK